MSLHQARAVAAARRAATYAFDVVLRDLRCWDEAANAYANALKATVKVTQSRCALSEMTLQPHEPEGGQRRQGVR